MSKKFLPVLLAPLLLAGCTTTFTNLTPQQQLRSTNNVYPVEVALQTRQQTLRWETIRPQVIVGQNSYPMRPTAQVTNRWEGFVPVPANANSVTYRYKFDFDYNAMGQPRKDSAISPEYNLRIVEDKGQ